MFVDTNVLLDLYAATGEVMLTAVARLIEHPEHLVTTFQVRHEFERNRMKLLQRLMSKAEAPRRTRVAVLFADVRTRKALDRHYDAIERSHERIAERIRRALERPTSDPVYRLAQKAWRASELFLDQADDAAPPILQRARSRVERGDPPRKSGDYTMGDAINWEWCLEACKVHDRDLLVVSRDKDFGAWQDDDTYLNTLLDAEFRRRVSSKRSATLTPQVTAALRALGDKVPDGMVEAERRERARGRGDGDGRVRDGERGGAGRGR